MAHGSALFSFHHRPQRRRSSSPPQRKRLENGFYAAWLGSRYLSPTVSSSSSAGCSWLLPRKSYFSPLSRTALRLPQRRRPRSLPLPTPRGPPTVAARARPAVATARREAATNQGTAELYLSLLLPSRWNGGPIGRKQEGGAWPPQRREERVAMFVTNGYRAGRAERGDEAGSGLVGKGRTRPSRVSGRAAVPRHLSSDPPKAPLLKKMKVSTYA